MAELPTPFPAGRLFYECGFGPLSGRLRVNSPGSKFLALLPPIKAAKAKCCSYFIGDRRFCDVAQEVEDGTSRGGLALLRGRFWVPSEVLLAYVKQMKTFLDRQLLTGQSLTAREGQVLQLLLRHLTNKEIAHQLSIGERTAKFHVSNVLNKLGLENRKNLLVSALLN